jgi:hypothetical protein
MHLLRRFESHRNLAASVGSSDRPVSTHFRWLRVTEDDGHVLPHGKRTGNPCVGTEADMWGTITTHLRVLSRRALQPFPGSLYLAGDTHDDRADT